MSGRQQRRQETKKRHGYASVAGKPLFRNDPLDHALDQMGRINNTYQVLPRALGLVQMGAGAAQALGGSALTAIGCAGTAGAGCLGSALIGIPNSLAGADNVRAGLDTALSGKPHATFGALALSQATGWRAEIAELVYGAGMASGPAALALWQRTGKAVQTANAMTNTAKAADKADDVAAAINRTIKTNRSQLQHGFKHAKDFGIVGNANNSTLAQFDDAIRNHVAASGTKVISGTYRGQPVTHFLDSSTGINVMRDPSGNFLSGWKLNPMQLENVLNRGSL